MFLRLSFYKLFLVCLTFGCTHVFAENELDKKWEFGVGVGSIYGPDYRGSSEYRNYTAPIPYVIYRGKYLRSDREGIRGQFLTFDRIQFTFSANAAITPHTAENKFRQGMPELGSTLELGPSLNIQLTGDETQHGWQLQLPWRAVYAVGGKTDQFVGSIFQPQFIFRDQWDQWTFSYRMGLTFADQQYHDYYYSVAAQYATQDRPEYSAHGGYSGWNSQASFYRKLQVNNIDTRVAFFIGYDNLNLTPFSQSPLLETYSVVHAGVAFIWVIK